MNYRVTYTDAAGDVRNADVPAADPLKAFDKVLTDLNPRDRSKVTLTDERGACIKLMALGPHTSKPTPKPKAAPAPPPEEPATVVELKRVPRPKRSKAKPAARAFAPRTTPFEPPLPDATKDQLDMFLASLTRSS